MEWKIDKFSSWDLRQTNKAAAGSCKTTAAEATLGASTWHWIEHFIEFIENSAATWRRFLTRLSILWRLCVSQSISWLVSVSANLRRSHVQPDQLGTYLHADLIEHQASRVVEETVSLPAELHGVLVHLVQHWEKKKQKNRDKANEEIGRAGQTSAPASLQDVCRYLWSCRRSRVWKPGWLWIAPPRSPEWETDSCRRKSADWPATPGRSSAGGGSGSEWRRHLKERNEGGMAWAKSHSVRWCNPEWGFWIEWGGGGRVWTRDPAEVKISSVPIRRSSSWRTSTASLMLQSGSIRVSQALRMELGVISENLALKTCKLDFTEVDCTWKKEQKNGGKKILQSKHTIYMTNKA